MIENKQCDRHIRLHLLRYVKINSCYILPLQTGMEGDMTNRDFALLLIVLLAGSGIVFAQSNSVSDQLYSSGVHAFNSQRYAEAINAFTQLEANGSQDPRAFFFRGLVHSRLGDTEAANADFEKAARMELTVAGRSFSVPKALERIQGRERTTIEQHRRAAKRAWVAEQDLRRQEEFLAKKAEDHQRFYKTIFDSGKSATSTASSAAVSDLALPFGAQAVAPFGVDPALRPKTTTDMTQGGLSENNPFYKDVNRVTVIEEPEPPKPQPRVRQQDPSAKGIFDVPNPEDEVDSFDSSALLNGGRSASSHRAKASGRSFGKGFSSLFKKTGE